MSFETVHDSYANRESQNLQNSQSFFFERGSISVDLISILARLQTSLTMSNLQFALVV